MNTIHSHAATALFALLCFAGCDHAAQPALCASPTCPTVVVSQIPANPSISVVQVYPGPPCVDIDRCPPVTVVLPDPDGGYTLKPGIEYSVWIYIFLSPAGCVSAYQVSVTWDSKSAQGSGCGDPYKQPYEGTPVNFGFFTPPSDSISSISPDQQITAIAETISASVRREIPIRFSNNP